MMLRRFVPALAALSLVASGAFAAPPEPNAKEREALELYKQPNSWFRERLKNPPETVDGQTLHPKIQYYQESRGRTAASKDTTKQQEAMMETPAGRAGVRLAVDRTWNYRTKITAEMAHVEDRDISGRGGDIHVRIYRPKVEETGPLPVLVYYHGGAWLFGSVDAVDRAVRLIANEAKVIVVSVDYRLTPEHPFPASQDDAEDAFLWTRANADSFGGDPAVIGVGGDSAGGQLSAVVSMRQLEARKPGPMLQLLYYPATSMTTNWPSYELFGEGYGLDKGLSDYVFAKVYPSEKLRRNPEVSPLLAKSVRGMPATILVTPGFDILRDQGRAYARRLEREGVAVTYLNYPSLTHGFMQHSGTIDDAEAACVETAQLFGRAIRSRAALLK